jgi:hypothetical protein
MNLLGIRRKGRPRAGLDDRGVKRQVRAPPRIRGPGRGSRGAGGPAVRLPYERSPSPGRSGLLISFASAKRRERLLVSPSLDSADALRRLANTPLDALVHERGIEEGEVFGFLSKVRSVKAAPAGHCPVRCARRGLCGSVRGGDRRLLPGTPMPCSGCRSLRRKGEGLSGPEKVWSGPRGFPFRRQARWIAPERAGVAHFRMRSLCSPQVGA